MMKISSALLAAATLAASLPAAAATSDRAATPESSVRLVTAVSATGSLAAVPAGIEIELQPGWKTYWRSPGDAGYPVSVDWQGSDNLAAADMRWPAPHRFTLFGLDTFGYSDRVVFPVTLVPERAGEPMRISATVNYLVCEAICIPYQADLVLDLPAGPSVAAPEAQLIAQYESQVPGPGAEHGIEIVSVGISDDAQPALSVVARSDIPFIAPDLLVEGSYDWRFPAPALERRNGNREVLLTIAAEPLTAEAPPLAGLPLVLTLVDGTRGAEFGVDAIAVGDVGGSGGGSGGGLPVVLLIALLGGLILNLMPCVLPVLSLKLLAVVGHGGGDRDAVRRSFLATAAGIVTAFLVLALALAGLRASGAAIGWGIQFQQPWFLLTMASVVTLFAANLAGWFEIPLPHWIGNRVAAMQRTQSGLAGPFGTGLLATLLATPCSAPFVGTAVGFALARQTGDIVAIFLAMGVGLAVPYLVVALRPQIATSLPQPGRWMIWLRRLLALALVGTAIWLLYVAMATVGSQAALISAALLGLLLLLLWQRARLGPGLRATALVLAALLIAGSLMPAFWRASDGGPGAAVADTLWQPFDQPAIATLVGEGRTVFVDVSADWCITCQVNKQLVLEREPVLGRLGDPALVAMLADWTRQDDSIAAYLASFGRYGIPFNVVYGPGAPAGIVLPELLDRDGVLEALDRAAGG